METDHLVILQPHSSYCPTGYEIRVTRLRKGESKTVRHFSKELDRGRMEFLAEIPGSAALFKTQEDKVQSQIKAERFRKSTRHATEGLYPNSGE
jgi:hypothetical protein